MSSLDYRALSRIDAESALTFQPLLFTKYWGNLDKSEPIRILDFGAVQSSSIDFYSNNEVPCFITIADCIDTLSGLQQDEQSEPDEASKILDELIPVNTQPYDIILAWECLNYIHPEVFACLNNKIKQVTHKNSLLYGYLYTSKYTTSYPCNFKIQNETNISCDDQTNSTAKPEIISATSLNKHFCDFEVTRSALIRNGLQEFMMQRVS